MKPVAPSNTGKRSTAQIAAITAGEPELDHKLLLDNSPVAIYTCNSSGLITWYNEAAVHLWGRRPLLMKEKWGGEYKIFYTDGRPMPRGKWPLQKALKNPSNTKHENIVIERPDGTFIDVLVYPKLIFDDQQNIIGAQNTLVDVSILHKEQSKHATLSAIVDSSDDAIIGKDINGIITSWNSGAERIFQYSENEVIGKHITILIPPSRMADEELILKNIQEGKKINHFETTRIKKDGEEIPVLLTVSPIKDASGNIVGASKVARDVSEKILGEERQAVLSAIVESSDDAIVSKDLNGKILSWNAGAEKIFGYQEKEMIGKSITKLIPGERMTEEKKILTQIRKGIKVDHFETVRKHKSGRKIPVSLTISPIKNSKGIIIGASKIARDISNRIKAEKELKKYTENLEILNSIGRSISENLDVQVVLQRVTDATTKLTGAAFGAFFYNHFNEQGKAMMLYTLSGAPREAFEKFGMPRHTDIFRPTFSGESIIRVADITKDPRYGNNHPHKGMPAGHLPVVSYLAVPVISSSGAIIGGLLFGHPKKGVFKKEHEDMILNIAAQAASSLDNSKLYEQVKTLSEKKDEFIALASHELKTPLTTIKGYLQVMAREASNKMNNLFLERSLEQVNKLNTLVEDLLHMSRLEAGKLELRLEVFDMKKLLLDVTETFSYSHNSHEIISNLGEVPVYVEGDKQRLEQVLVNFLSNAVKYSPGADKIFLKLRTKGKKVTVSVRDEGIGLTEEQQTQVFTRFYRAENTKGISGLGLGLYLTKQIIDRHKGKIWLKSEPEVGTEFYFSLPLKEIQ